MSTGRQSDPPTPVDPDPGLVSISFSGDGAEYFRLWVVNLLLTALTLGVYSAWAKVRKTKYFYQNTRLDGNVFDYHGRPRAILRGRVVALTLAAAYTWTFQFSLAAGVMTALVLCAAGPWLLMRAQVFRLSNTSYRGLRFGFRADTNTAYRVATPVLGLWFANGPPPRWPRSRTGYPRPGYSGRRR